MTPLEKYSQDENFEIVERKGHHNVGTGAARYPGASCGCSPDTEGGYAYRDVVVKSTNDEEHWDKIRFYHQSPVVKKNDDTIKIDAHGYGNSSTTRERINKELPIGYRLVQRDHEVKLRVPGGDNIDVSMFPLYIDLDPKAPGLEWQIRQHSRVIVDGMVAP